jgi:hypothetical protein
VEKVGKMDDFLLDENIQPSKLIHTCDVPPKTYHKLMEKIFDMVHHIRFVSLGHLGKLVVLK